MAIARTRVERFKPYGQKTGDPPSVAYLKGLEALEAIGQRRPKIPAKIPEKNRGEPNHSLPPIASKSIKPMDLDQSIRD
ncbi:MAG: hypothetical protein Fur0042_23080 [Cyanophyceae cyanobacterium]